MGWAAMTILTEWSQAGLAAAGGSAVSPSGSPLAPLLAAGVGTEMPGAKWLSLAAMVVGLSALMWTFRRQLKRRAAAAAERLPTPAERLESIRRETDVRDQIEARLVETLELSQRLAAELDNKATRLERLIAEAEERIRRLERAGRVGTVPAGNGHGTAGPDPITRQVYELADEGLRPVEIARRLGQHTGKVELILALRNQ